MGLKNYFTKIYDKLFVWQWTIGFSHVKIQDIIRLKSFDPDIFWSPIEPYERFFADPFFLSKSNGQYYIMAEELDIKKNYGKISLLTFNDSFRKIEEKILLDTKCHLSYPFIFLENNKTYVFPEAAKSGGLPCYEYDKVEKKLIFLQNVIEDPVIDPTVLKYNNKYWIFGTLPGKNACGNLLIFFSDNILGPYKQHPKNPLTNSQNGSRPAGNFINVDGILYRPSQNCGNRYGESITIHKLNVLNENEYKEEFYMQLTINKKNSLNRGIHTIHTINAVQGLIVVDGAKRLFAPLFKTKQWVKKRLGKL
jgi:hypothetical protein